MPNGFPATESGVEIKLLKKILKDPEDAANWLLIDKKPEPVDAIAKRINNPVKTVQTIVDGLVAKGLINALKMGDTYHYHVQPYVIGMYEKNYLYGLVDEEYSKLFEAYLPEWSQGYGGYEPAEVRVIPVGESVPVENAVYAYDERDGDGY